MSKIEMNKIYINGYGEKVRIIAVDRVNAEYPVVGLVTDLSHGDERTECYTKDGKFLSNETKDEEDLQEYNPAMDLKVDQPIWVRDFHLDGWKPRHFAEYKDGRVWTFSEGLTSHSCGTAGNVGWKYFTTQKPNA